MTSDTESDLSYSDTPWRSADTLRGQVDAAEYKHVVPGLLFLEYISGSFQPRRDELPADLTKDGIQPDQSDRLLESRAEYTAERVVRVPPESCRPNLQNQATRPDIATLIDDAILAIERDNPNLKSRLPRNDARRGLEPVTMKGLIDLIAGIEFKGSRDKARDTLGRVYDPARGSGGMFVPCEKFVAAHGDKREDISIYGREFNPTTCRLAHVTSPFTASKPTSAPSPLIRSFAPGIPTARRTWSVLIRRSTAPTPPAQLLRRKRYNHSRMASAERTSECI